MKTLPPLRTLLATALALGAALPARAASGDDDFFSSVATARSAVLDQATLSKNLFRRTTQESGPRDPLLTMQKPLIDMIKKVEPSIVFLRMEIPAKKSDDEDEPAPAKPPKKNGHATCTGFFVDAAKYMGRPSVIATNAHCVEMLSVGAEIAVGLYDGDDNRLKMTRGKVLAFGDSRAAKDIAFVELGDTSLDRRPLPLWEKLDVGEQVVAIGHPLGLAFSVSKGIVSALERDHLDEEFVLDVTQSDVAVNPGNSGGPLFNLWGSVVGINTMIASESGGFEGISMSVPAAYVVAAMRQFARTGNLKIGSLRIAVSAGAADPYAVDPGPEKNLTVQAVDADGAGAAAGLKPKDEIVRVDGVALDGLPPRKAEKAFLAYMRYMSPGEKTTLVVRRDGREVTLEATLGEPAPRQAPRPDWAPIPPKPKPQAAPMSYTTL